MMQLLRELRDVFDRIGCWQVYQGVSVLGVNIVDDHIDAFDFGIVGEKPRYIGCGGFGKYWARVAGLPRSNESSQRQ